MSSTTIEQMLIGIVIIAIILICYFFFVFIRGGIASKKYWCLFLGALILLMIGLFGTRISKIKVGPVEVDFKGIKRISAALAAADPQFASYIAGQVPGNPEQSAIAKIERIENPKQLRQLINYQQKGDSLYFYPKVDGKEKELRVGSASDIYKGRRYLNAEYTDNPKVSLNVDMETLPPNQF